MHLTVSGVLAEAGHVSLSLMTNSAATAIFNTDLASRSDTAPEWIELFPTGPAIRARDDRSWTLFPQIVVDAFKANNAPLPIDWEHAQAHLAPKGQEAPAAGWITDVQERTGSIWGRVEWGAKAAQQIVERAYRFVSPDFQYRKDGVITRLNGAALVNRPALEMTALSREQTSMENDDMSKAIAKALGLAEGADEAAILAALTGRDNERKALCQSLQIVAGSDSAAITTAITKLQKDTETALAAVQSNAGNAEVLALQTDLKETRTALAALQLKDRDREIDGALDRAVTAGKITPASRDTYRAMCALEGGLDKFEALLKTLPVIGDPSSLDTKTAQTAADDVDPRALAAAARKYQDEQAAHGRTISISEAVSYVKENKS